PMTEMLNEMIKKISPNSSATPVFPLSPSTTTTTPAPTNHNNNRAHGSDTIIINNNFNHNSNVNTPVTENPLAITHEKPLITEYKHTNINTPITEKPLAITHEKHLAIEHKPGHVGKQRTREEELGQSSLLTEDEDAEFDYSTGEWVPQSKFDISHFNNSDFDTDTLSLPLTSEEIINPSTELINPSTPLTTTNLTTSSSYDPQIASCTATTRPQVPIYLMVTVLSSMYFIYY
ncbi:MAG TPA: hypothetical protein VIY47_15760, partial [Ignavibacteriaceae bacterium]